jgi:hypothetical protein
MNSGAFARGQVAMPNCITTKSASGLGALKDWQPLIGTALNVATVVIIAICVTSALTAATKRTEFFFEFTKRYHAIRTGAHELDNRVKTKPNPLLDEGDAHQIYFQLFGLMYDEISASQKGFLDKEVLVEWMTWQMHDYAGGTFSIGGVSYQDGWRSWLITPASDHKLTPIVERIFACKEKKCVDRALE